MGLGKMDTWLVWCVNHYSIWEVSGSIWSEQKHDCALRPSGAWWRHDELFVDLCLVLWWLGRGVWGKRMLNHSVKQNIVEPEESWFFWCALGCQLILFLWTFLILTKAFNPNMTPGAGTQHPCTLWYEAIKRARISQQLWCGELNHERAY